jgi:hypothetical protein
MHLQPSTVAYDCSQTADDRSVYQYTCIVLMRTWL